jgi:hypothetical protein
MTKTQLKKKAVTRISITISEDDLKIWQKEAKNMTLSAFIREAVNEYIKIQEPSKRNSLFDLYLEQRDSFRHIKEKLESLEDIEGELVDLEEAMAKYNMIDPKLLDGKVEWNTKKK